MIGKKSWGFIVFVILLTTLSIFQPWNSRTNTLDTIIPDIGTETGDEPLIAYAQIYGNTYTMTLSELLKMTEGVDEACWIAWEKLNLVIEYAFVFDDEGNTIMKSLSMYLSFLVYNASSETRTIRFGADQDIEFLQGGGYIEFMKDFTLESSKYRLASFVIHWPDIVAQTQCITLFFDSYNQSGDFIVRSYVQGALTPTTEI